jgi:Cu/Ag efflux protein CusF
MTTEVPAALTRAIPAYVVAAASSFSRIHGTIVSIDRKNGTFLIHHDPFSGMPMAMTMQVKPKKRSDLDGLHEGEVIDATADTSVEPWPITGIRPAAQRATHR